MSHNYGFLRDPAFHAFLHAIDVEEAEKARREGCLTCGGALHVANYLRAPMGGPSTRAMRLSFCCAREGCRRRHTPGSVRFLGRKVYLGVIVLLASVVYHGLPPHRRQRLDARLGVSERTLVRWRHWWLRDFAGSRFWQAMRGFFDTPVERDDLPVSLLERFEGAVRDQALATLRFLAPIAGGKGMAVRAF